MNTFISYGRIGRMKIKVRGFEPVVKEHLKHTSTYVANGETHTHYPEVELPKRADVGSAGYDFYAPCDIKLIPNQKQIVWSNVKAYMGINEVLQLYPRSSLGSKGMVLANTVGIVDMSYYGNESNDGNIGFVLLNTSGTTIEIKKGERFAQGVFTYFLVTDEDVTLSTERLGGFGSSNSTNQ